MRVCGAPNSRGKPCQQTILTESGRCRRHVDSEAPPLTTEGNHGKARPGNQNARKHGLFAECLDEHGYAVYQAAKAMSPTDIARDSAEFLLGQIAQAFTSSDAMWEVAGPLGGFLRDQERAGLLPPGTADKLLRKLYAPDVGALGKALSPLKGLLELKAQQQAKGGGLSDALRAVRERRGDGAGGEP